MIVPAPTTTTTASSPTLAPSVSDSETGADGEVITARLLADKEQCFGQSALCNALYRSNLAFESGRVEGETVAVNLSSELILGGSCDAPRVKAQPEQTAMTATGVRSASVSFDGVPLDELLSGM